MGAAATRLPDQLDASRFVDPACYDDPPPACASTQTVAITRYASAVASGQRGRGRGRCLLHRPRFEPGLISRSTRLRGVPAEAHRLEALDRLREECAVASDETEGA